MFEKIKARIWSRRLGKKTGQAVGIGIIKADDGKKAAFDAWAARCAENMRPNAHSIVEVENWLLEQYPAEPIEFGDIRMRMQVAEIVRNFYPEMLETKVTLPKDKSYKEYERWSIEADKAHEEAMQVDPDALGLQFSMYRIPLDGDGGIEVCLEAKSGQVSVSGGALSDALYPAMQEFLCALTKFRGLTQADIDGKTPRFLAYITTLRDAGEPGFEMEKS